MNWKFPPADHRINTIFDVNAFRARLERENWRDWITAGLPRAKRKAEQFFASNPEARMFVTPVWHPDGAVRLVQIGPRGGHRILWTFGRDI